MQGEKRNLLPPELEQQIKIYSDTHNTNSNCYALNLDEIGDIFLVWKEGAKCELN